MNEMAIYGKEPHSTEKGPAAWSDSNGRGNARPRPRVGGEDGSEVCGHERTGPATLEDQVRVLTETGFVASGGGLRRLFEVE